MTDDRLPVGYIEVGHIKYFPPTNSQSHSHHVRFMEQHRLDFTAPNGIKSTSEVTIYREIHLVIVSETGEGMSVTNAAEVIATEVVKRYGLDPKRMLFIEHYPESQRPEPYGESYDIVTFTWGKHGAYNPTWYYLSPAQFTDILHSIHH